MTENVSEPVMDELEQTAEEIIKHEKATIEVLKTTGSKKGLRKTSVLIMETGQSEKYGTVRLACSINRSTWYVATERPVEDREGILAIRHEREAVNQFTSLCEAE